MEREDRRLEDRVTVLEVQFSNLSRQVSDRISDDVRRWDEHLKITEVGRNEARSDREKIMALLQENREHIAQANLAGRLIIKITAVIAGLPALAYVIVKLMQELFPPKTPLHAIFAMAVTAAMFYACTGI